MSPAIILFAAPIFLLTVFLEIWLRKRRGLPFDAKDGATSVGMGFGFLLLNLALKGATLALFQVVYDHRLLDLGDHLWVFPLALVVQDFVFYWTHRFAHEIRFFWATHEAHHSSEQYTLTTALRQPWTEPLAMPLMLLLPLVGFPPLTLMAVHTVSLIYQYWIHTELITKLGPLEWVFNTPSHHRVHHGSNPRYIDKNHGGILIVWDRLFGTFQEEDEVPVYGLTKPLEKRDIFHASFNEWLAIGRDLARANTWKGRLRSVFGRTGTDYLAGERLTGSVQSSFAAMPRRTPPPPHTAAITRP